MGVLKSATAKVIFLLVVKLKSYPEPDTEQFSPPARLEFRAHLIQPFRQHFTAFFSWTTRDEIVRSKSKEIQNSTFLLIWRQYFLTNQTH